MSCADQAARALQDLLAEIDALIEKGKAECLDVGCAGNEPCIAYTDGMEAVRELVARRLG